MPSTTEIAAYSAIAITLLTALLGYVRLGKLTPLEVSQKNTNEISAQSIIIKDLQTELIRVRGDFDKCIEETRKLGVEHTAALLLLRAELTACKHEFAEAKTQWAATELHLRRLMDSKLT